MKAPPKEPARGWSLGPTLDRLIAPFAPRWAAQRARDRAAFETLHAFYNAAETSRTTADWPKKQLSADQAIIPDFQNTTARARLAVANNWAGASIIQAGRRHIVGTGISVRSRARDEQGEPIKEFNERADLLWRDWCRRKDHCDFERRKTFVEMQGLMVSEFLTVGEGFAIRMTDSRRNRDGLSPLMVHVIEPEMLAWEMSYSPTRPGNKIRGGIEIDEEGRSLGLWIHPKGHRLEQYRAAAPEFVPIEQVCHLFRQERPQQTHGISRLASILKKLWHLEMYDSYQIVRARFEAAIGMTIESDPNMPEYGASLPSVDDPAARSTDSALNITIQPGMVNALPPGKKANFHAPTTPGGTYAPFMTQQLKEVAAGAGTDLPTLLRDFTQGSFSAQRQAMLERDKETDPIQNLLIDDFIRPVREDFITLEIIAGRLEAPGFFEDPVIALRYLDAGYHRPPKPWIDPVKQAAAAQVAVEQRFTTRAAIIAENFGEDWRETFDQIDDEQAYADELGVTLPDGASSTPQAATDPGAPDASAPPEGAADPSQQPVTQSARPGITRRVMQRALAHAVED